MHGSGPGRSALHPAGPPDGWRGVAHRLGRDLAVNVSRIGVVWLPVVAAGPGREAIQQRIAHAFYDELLELAER